MRKRLSLLAVASFGALASGAVRDVHAQTPPPPPPKFDVRPSAGPVTTPPTPPPATPPARAAAPPPSGGAKGRPADASAGAAGAAGSTSGKAQADTDKLSQFEQSMDFEPRSPNYRVSFSLEDADLSELVRVIGQLTGKRFIFGGKIRNIKASVYSPQKVTVAEAYQAFLSILETNGLTVIPHGRFLKIVETAGIASQTTPTIGPQQGAPTEDRYVTRMHRLRNVSADEVANLLGKFKSKDADVSSYSAGNMLILTDTGTNIRRMMSIVEEIDVGGAGDQIWLEPIYYATASDIASRVNELFDIKSGSSGPSQGGKGAPAQSAAGGGAGAGGGDLHISKIMADERTNKVIIVATEKAYLRVLELIKKMDVPQTTEGEIHVLPLQHADAVELTKTLNEIVSGSGSSGGGPPGRGQQQQSSQQPSGIFEGAVKVSADKATNSIVVTSSMRDFASLHAVVDRLDLPRRSVFIEAAILDLSITRSNILGFDFHGGDTFTGGSSSGTGLIYGGLNPMKTILPPDPTQLQGLALGVRGPEIPGSQTLLGQSISIPSFGMLLQAIATDTDTDVLSTPHILATDNQKAIINIGENIPLQQNIGFPSIPNIPGVSGATSAAGLAGLGGLSGLGGATSQRQDVGTKLTITPHLNDSNEVRLEVNEEISEAKAAVGNAAVVPIVKRNAETMLVVQDQQTVIIGGLMRNRVARTVNKIPVLGDIPVLGALFRKTEDRMEKTNLILILTPYIVRDQGDLRTIYERKMEERQQFLDRYFVFNDDSDYQPPKDYSRTIGLIEFMRQSYRDVEEKKKRDELLKPKELKTHEPGEPLEMPATPRAPGVNPSAPATPAPPTRGGGPVVTPPTRQITREVER
ncbi:type II secretion system secretin GspD [Pendulispora albinea]|uniref:Type II secretion system secretin GspD n=1 Tax=Pendulispora albinea TaxID=2741071 RepID=A0ABZ2LQS5_9BACT